MSASRNLPTFVLDTSVVLKWFVEDQETEIEVARLLQGAYVDGTCLLIAPELLLFELANGLRAGRRFTAAEVLRAVDHVIDLELQLEPFRRSTLAKAVEICGSYRAAVYDCYFLAVAVESGGLFVTADEIFLRKTSGHPSVKSLRRLKPVLQELAAQGEARKPTNSRLT